MTKYSSDRRVDLNGSITETSGSGDDLIITTTAVDGTVSTFRPIDDPALPGLRSLVDPNLRSDLLAGLLGRSINVGTRTDARIVRYRAQRRATVRIEIHDSSPSQDQSESHLIVFAKVFHDLGKAASTASSLTHLVPQLTSEMHTRLPMLLAHHDALGIVVLQEITGQPLDLPHPLGTTKYPLDTAVESFNRVGASLAVLHGLNSNKLPLRLTEVDFSKAETRAGHVTDTVTRKTISDLLALLKASGLANPPRLVPVHGDCKPSQILLGPDIALLDPDHLGAGDPAADIAQMHVSLFQEAIRRDGALGGVATNTARLLIEAFDTAYLQTQLKPDATLLERVRWLEALTMARKAFRADSRHPGSPLAGALAASAVQLWG